MRVKAPYIILSFEHTTDAMAMEKFCAERNLPGRMIPLPREISAGCGLAWRVSEAEYAVHKDVYHEAGGFTYKEHFLIM